MSWILSILALLGKLFWNFNPINRGAISVSASSRLYMPLFFQEPGKNVETTWKYLSYDDLLRKWIRDYILAGTAKGETPAITFLLGPDNCNGHIFSDFPVVDGTRLDNAVSAIQELTNDGIAVFPCLYADDCDPRWYEIEKHLEGWRKVHEKIGHLVTGYVLSIETNEQAVSREHIESGIEKMRQAMPGKVWYGTHLNWHAQSHISGYKWIGSANNSTPRNAQFILVETSWQPDKGDAAGLRGLQDEFSSIKSREPNLLLVWHEYNLNPNGSIYKQQRDWLRAQKPWGVG